MPDRATVLKASAAAAAAAAAVAVVAARARRQPDERTLPVLEELGGDEQTVPTSDGGRLAVTVAGPPASRPFVLIHGWVCDRSSWLPVARLLAGQGHRVVLYDQRGHGRSRAGDRGFEVEALGDDLRSVLEAMDATDAVVAGHSMGGMAVQAFATGHPEVVADRVRGLALVATASERVVRDGAYTRLLLAAVAHRALDRAMGSPRIGPWLVRNAVGHRPARAWLDSLRTTFAATPAEVRAGCLAAMGKMNLSSRLASVSTPTVVMVGSRDMVIRPSRGRLLARLIPGARLEVVEGAGHMLPYEAPERVAAALLSL